MKAIKALFVASASLLAASSVAMAQTSIPAAPTPAAPKAAASNQAVASTAATSAPASPAAAVPAAEAPTGVAVYFASGSSSLTPQEQVKLDEATRIFNDGKPIVMIITGMADATGAPGPNLVLSQRRADVVFQGLIARGLPPSRFQLLATGATAALVGQEPSGADQAFRKVEITWR
jgi:outer membrane protein OmpA-like peptidoglycan-associated protein